MEKKTETKKKAGKPKATATKKTKKPATTKKVEEVKKEVVTATDETVEVKPVVEETAKTVEQEVIVAVEEQDVKTEPKVLEESPKEIAVEEEKPVHKELEEPQRNISQIAEEIQTEVSGDEIETENIVKSQPKEDQDEKPPKKRNKIMRYLSYLWNGIEID